jgi:protocatechuate 3,4-dioxygenase beta subunit
MISRIYKISLIIFAAVVLASSQTNPEKTATASVSGKVTIKNKGVAGIVVYAEQENSRGYTNSNSRATTDQNGNYRIANLPAATYTIRPIAPSFVLEQESTDNNSVVVSEGENVEGINFSMVPGAVITGRITDADGKPLIEQRVLLIPIGATKFDGRSFDVRTDDRGIYRAFGLRAGKYKVSVGQNESLPIPGDAGPYYRQTFYPSVNEFEKAATIDVKEGSEATNIDIVVGPPVSMYKVTGRILDAETGKPLFNINYGVYQGHDHGGASVIGRNFTNANGEFKLESVRPGKYVVFIVPGDSDVRADSVSFEVVDRDVDDLVINAGKGASLSGVVVFEGKPDDFFIRAWINNSDHYFGGSVLRVNPDGSFRVGGLQKGPVRFNLSSRARNDLRPMDIVRVERDGVPLTTDLRLKEGEQVTGLRLVVKYLTGAIRGEIKVEDDESLPNSRMFVGVTPLDANRSWFQSTGNPSAQLDSRKRFMIQPLAAGTYEVSVVVAEPGRWDTARTFKQQVTVADNQVSEVTISVKSKP